MLEVEFNSGSVYQYDGATADHYAGMTGERGSIGTYFGREVKDRLQCFKIDAAGERVPIAAAMASAKSIDYLLSLAVRAALIADPGERMHAGAFPLVQASGHPTPWPCDKTMREWCDGLKQSEATAAIQWLKERAP